MLCIIFLSIEGKFCQKRDHTVIILRLAHCSVTPSRRTWVVCRHVTTRSWPLSDYVSQHSSETHITMLPVPLVLFLALIISLAVFVPLTGVLVRFRANYNPKGLQLDSDGGAVPYTGPVLRSYFGMMIRVYRLEVRMQMFLFLVQPKARHLGGFRPLQRIEYVALPFTSMFTVLILYCSANCHQQLHRRHHCSSFHRYGASTSW
jgi:hypothetical protein